MFSAMSNQAKRVALVVSIELAIALIFVVGADSAGSELYILYQSYFADVAIPFGFYFLLSIAQHRRPVFTPWWRKALAVFTLCAASEILQFFGIYALARVFDPLDFVMYGTGVSLAAIVDRRILATTLSFWI